jgi:hypothetical protein
MQAILGSITRIEEGEADAAAASDDPAHPKPLKVSFKPRCILPERQAIPEWLKDATLTVTRAVPDPREVGNEGDCIVLSVVESRMYLAPLTVTPDIQTGAMPETLRLHLAWWKDENPPEVTVRANGREKTQKWTKVDGKNEFHAAVETAPFFSFSPTLPARFEITSGPMKTSATVLPPNGNGFHPVPVSDNATGGERHRAENVFFRVEIDARTQATCIASLVEKGRGLDHFAPLTDRERIAHPLFWGGHIDRLRLGWEMHGKMAETALTVRDAARSGEDASRLALEGAIEDTLRTRVAYTLFDSLPILLIEREYYFEKGKEEKKDEDKEKPKEAIDELKMASASFRAAFAAEWDSVSGSRILCTDGETLATLRPSGPGEYYRANGWRMADGWAMVEHPRRRAWALYLLDRSVPAPTLHYWSGDGVLTLEPGWDYRPIPTGSAFSVATALIAGELGGASANGAWVATRNHLPGGGILCATVARLKTAENGERLTATFRYRESMQAVPLERLLLPGVGNVYVATARFEGATLDGQWDLSVAGIASRTATGDGTQGGKP